MNYGDSKRPRNQRNLSFSCILYSRDMCIFLGHLFSLLCHGRTINGGLSSASLILNFCFVLGCKAEIFLVAGAGVVATPGPCLAVLEILKSEIFIISIIITFHQPQVSPPVLQPSCLTWPHLKVLSQKDEKIRQSGGYACVQGLGEKGAPSKRESGQ